MRRATTPMATRQSPRRKARCLQGPMSMLNSTIQEGGLGMLAARIRTYVPHRHTLSLLGNRQGPRARYLGVRKNTFDLRRLAAVQNLETISRRSSIPTLKVI